MKNYFGEELQVFEGSGTSANTIACAQTLTVSIDADQVDVSCKDSGRYGASLAGKINWSIQTQNLYETGGTEQAPINGYKKLVKALINNTPMLLTWASVANYDTAMSAGGDSDGHIFNETSKAESANDLFYGYATVTSIELNADSGSLATYSATFSGRGAINDGGKAGA